LIGVKRTVMVRYVEEVQSRVICGLAFHIFEEVGMHLAGTSLRSTDPASLSIMPLLISIRLTNADPGWAPIGGVQDLKQFWG